MRIHGWTWTAIVAAAVILLAANLWCWQPGIGGSRPGRPPGTEVELYFGWPATYRAEWWRSDDPTLVPTLLGRAPFFHPAGEMERRARYAGVWAAVVDTAFGAAMLVLVGVVTEARVRGWRRGMSLGLGLATIVLAGAWAAAGRVGVHL